MAALSITDTRRATLRAFFDTKRGGFRLRLVAVAIAVAVGCLSVFPSSSQAVVDPAPGPQLQESPANLRSSLWCSEAVKTSAKAPVLLVHGTAATPAEDFTGNLSLYLPRAGYPVCTVTIPRRSMTDVQVNVEYVVHAIRAVSARSGGKIDVIAHSQGAFLTTYALRFWPDLALKVDDFIGYAGTYTYGSDLAPVLCAVICTAAYHQLSPGSRTLEAVVRRSLPRGPSYTAFSSNLDEIIIPQPMASHLVAPGARNYVLQDHCPLDVAEHLFITFEKPFLQLTLDALTHRGPAELERIPRLSCGLLPQAAGTVPSLVTFLLGASQVMARYAVRDEPPLRCYLRPACAGR